MGEPVIRAKWCWTRYQKLELAGKLRVYPQVVAKLKVKVEE
ncbi:MAG: hypothetical protein ACLRWF_07850 [Ruthenibacterium sp.]